MDRDVCQVCEAYSHPLLFACPFCGTPRESLFELAATVHAAAYEDREWSTQEADAFKTLTERLSGLSGGDGLPEFRQSEVERLRRPTGRRIWAEVREKSSRQFNRTRDRLSRAAISQIGLRYEGGLPALPPGAEVTATVERNALTIKDSRSDAVLAQAPLAHILGIQAYPSNAALLNGWVGLSFGGATYLTSPTFPGGSLVIVHAQTGRPVQWGLGNRSGLFNRKADYAGFCMMRVSLAGGASSAARGRLGGAAPADYARELGFSVADASPAIPPPPTSDVSADLPTAMRQLNSLRDEGLITQAEYDDKRASLLHRL